MAYSIFDSSDGRIRKEKYGRVSSGVWNFFIKNSEKYGFEEREGQQNLALDIVDALEAHQHIAAEAGVGIGKSFAYLVPALLLNREFQRPVAIATSTIALQEQLERDIEKVATILNLYPDVVLAKGQTHYICKARAQQFLSRETDPFFMKLQEDIQKNKAERGEFKYDIPSAIWNSINIREYGMKTCGGCADRMFCTFRVRRDIMKHTYGIILCNQDLLTVHLQKVAAGMNGLLSADLSLIIVDEAHNLEEKVRNAYTSKVNSRQVLSAVRKARKSVRERNTNIDKQIEALETYLKNIDQILQNSIEHQIKTAIGDMKYAERFFLNFQERFKRAVTAALNCLSEISEQIQLFTEIAEFNDFLVDEVIQLQQFFDQLRTQNEKYLFWLERRGNTIEIVSTPKNTASLVNMLYFSRSRYRTVMTSATLTSSSYGSEEDQYRYFISNTGFPIEDGSGFLSEPKPSPFPYDEHAMIYYAADLPHPTQDHEAFVNQAVDRLVSLFEISHGRALVLFTAKADLEEVWTQLQAKELSYNILRQDNSASQERVLKAFQDDVDSILLGTGAYWEGIDISGKSLSNLIIFRLPFPVPDPVIQYKSTVAEDAMRDVLVPEMILKLKQGIGRLIRNDNDQGIVSILDPRLSETSTAPYKAVVWEALPIKAKTDSLEKIRSFYESRFSEN